LAATQNTGFLHGAKIGEQAYRIRVRPALKNKKGNLSEFCQLWLLKEGEMIYSLRNLLISFSIVLLVVLLLVLFVFSTLRSQEKEHDRISQARVAMQALGPAVIHAQEHKNDVLNHLVNHPSLVPASSGAATKLKEDITVLTRLANEDPGNKASYQRLVFLIDQMNKIDQRSENVVNRLNSLVGEIKTLTSQLEEENRQVMNVAYSNSHTLTKRTFSFVRALSILIAIILLISFFFIYHDLSTRKKYVDQLKTFNDDLEKKVQEKTMEIRDSEEKYHLLFESVSDAYVMVDRDGRVIDFNPSFKNILGGKPVQVGGFLMEHISEKYRASVAASLETAFTGKKIEYELNRGDDSDVSWLALTYMPASNDPGQVASVYIVAKDISQRKKIELALMAAETRFRSIVEQSLVGVYIIGDGKFLYVNPKLAEIFGYSQEELIGEDPLKVIALADREKVKENILVRVRKEKPMLHYEANGLSKEGKLVRLEIICSGNLEVPKEAIIGSLLDISQRKKVEVEKDKVVHLLNERVKELTTLYQVSRVFQSKGLDMKETLQEVVSLLPSAWQYEEVAAARLKLGDMEITTPNYGTPVHQQVATFPTSQGTGSIEVIYLEKKPNATEDAFFPEERNLLNMVADMLRVYFARRHEADALRKSEEDMVMHKVQAQKSITRAIINAEEKERNKIGQELHDNINQILVSVKLYLSVAQESAEAGSRDLIVSSIGLVDNAIQEIRALSKSQVTPVKEVDLEELIQSLIEKLEDSTSIRATFEYDLTDHVLSDDLKLNIYRIIQEQVNNVIKHAEADHIVIRILGEDKLLCIQVSDDGRGFDTDQVRKGIGISNMINRVESFNGELTIESSIGGGTKVMVRIPY
jgi:PAS domain S-box-containing protein